MSYRIDPVDNSIVIEGFEKGIAESPFLGISDIRNVNINSIPGEVSVGFSTIANSRTITTSFTVVSADSSTDYITCTSTSGLENGMAITFSTTPTFTSTPTVSANTPYWIGNFSGGGANTFKLYTDFDASNVLDITGTGTGSYNLINVGGGAVSGVIQGPKYFTYDPTRNYYFMLDDKGQVWTNKSVTTSNFWKYTGNKVPGGSYTSGNGLVYYQASNGDGFIFVFHNSSIDYLKTNATFSWQYQWNPTAGTVAGYSSTPSVMLNSAVSFTGSHESLVGQDNTVYYCDTNFLGSFFEKPTKTFNPVDNTTYTYAKNALSLPVIDGANCLAELGVKLLVGGQRNLIYPWDRVSTSFTYPIWLSENVVTKMTTVNSNAYVFAGNRGRIYITNGSQAQLFKKIPDHISGTVEPYFTWGGTAFNKNKLYFSAMAKTNSGTSLTTGNNAYGGLWVIDLNTESMWLSNQLSYATYAGYATALIVITPTTINPQNPSGQGFYIGWDSGVTTYGLDGTSSNPYSGSQAYIDSDLIPVGTFNKPRDLERIEFKLTKPMVANESVTLNYRTDFSQNYTLIGTTTSAVFSDSYPINWKNAQWLQIQAVLNSTTTNPSYTRLKEFRITGLK